MSRDLRSSRATVEGGHAVWEIQVHPASIRGKVRFFFLSRRALGWLAVGLAAAAGLVVAGAALAPQGARTVALVVQMAVVRQDARVERAQLQRHLDALDALERRLAELRYCQRRIALALGVRQEEVGLGGYGPAVGKPFTDPLAAEAVRRAALLESDCGALQALAAELTDFAARHADILRTVPSVSPLPNGTFVLTSPFGERTSPFTGEPDVHTGIDLAAAEGTPVSATGAGTVTFAGRIPLRTSVHWWRYGNLVVVAHGDRYLTLYAHLQQATVRAGDRLTRGQVVGTVGTTGWSTAPHLHYEVRLRDTTGSFVPVDPRIFVLNYRWRDDEIALAARRNAPRPAFEPLPPTVEAR